MNPKPLTKSTSQSIQTSCRLEGLSTWSPQTHLAGLRLDGGSVAIDESYFTCCAGLGISSDMNVSNVATRCTLIDRCSQLVSFLQQALKGTSGVPLNVVLSASSGSAGDETTAKILLAVERWRTLHARACKENPRGRLIADVSRISENIVDSWAALSTLIWHDHVLVLGHRLGSGPIPIADWTARIQKNKAQRCIIALTDVHNLWEAPLLDEFEHMVSFVSMVGRPLWILQRPKAKGAKAEQENSSQAPQTSGFKSGVKKRIDSYRQQTVEHWISSQCLARLEEICELPRLPRPAPVKS